MARMPQAHAVAFILAASLAPAVVDAQARWLRPDSSVPTSGRQGSVLIRANTTHMVTFGGVGLDPNTGANVFPSIDAYNLESDAWAPYDIGLTATSAFNWRVAFPAVAPVEPDLINPSLTYLFGGQGANGQNVNRLVALRPESVSVPAVNGTVPSTRRLAAMCHLRNCYGAGAACLVLHGGTTSGSNALADLHVLDMRGTPFRWTQPTTAGVTVPGRHSHSCVASPDGTQAFFFGGQTALGASNDLFVFAPQGFADPRLDTPEMLNIAIGKNASQVATDMTWNAAGAGRATDGNFATNHYSLANAPASSTTQNMCTHTPTMANPWWSVDLGSVQQLSHLRIWDRTDCCPGRIAGFEIRVSNSATFDAGLAPCVNPYADVYDTTATIDLSLTPGGRCSAGRYVYISLPGPSRLLTLCEVGVYVKRPFAWRQLSGVAEVAQGKRTEQSSTELCCAGGDSSRAVDGDTSNSDYNRGSCSHTLTTNLVANAPYWLVDLGTTFDVSSIVVWPRMDCCASFRNTRWEMFVGLSRDPAYSTRVPDVPTAMTPGGTNSFTMNMAAPTRGRYVRVQRPFVNGDDNILQICELKVFASLLLDQPSPRSGAATVAFGGSLMVFGGTDGSGFKLNDLRLFDLTNKRWFPLTPPLNTPPQLRSNAAMLILASSRVAVFGGASPVDALSDVSYFEAATCPPLQLSDGVTNVRTTHSGTMTLFDCLPGFTHANSGNPVVCNPATGVWQGIYNLATGRVCLPVGPSAPTVTGATALGPDSVRVQWSPPSVPNGLASYIVEAASEATWVERFNSALGPSDAATAWGFRDFASTSTITFPGGLARIDANPNVDCTAANPLGCPVYSRAWPTAAGIPGNDFAFEGWVGFDSNTVQPTQFAGLALLQDGTPYARNHTLALWAGLYLGTNNAQWSVRWGSGTYASVFNVPFSKPIYGVWVRLERAAPAVGAWDPVTNPSTYRAAFRFTVRDTWQFMPGALRDSDLPATPAGTPPALDASTIRVGLTLRNSNGGARAAVLADNLRISSRACLDPGTMRVVPSSQTSAVLTGLTPGGVYKFQVTGASAAVVGTPSNVFGPLALPTPPSASPVPLTGNIALFKPASQVNRYVENDQGPEKGNDGIVDPLNFFQTAIPSQGSCGDLGCWWQVDLGVPTDVRRIRVVNRYDQAVTIARAVGLEVAVTQTGGTSWINTIGKLCPISDGSLQTPPYVANVTCTATGRFVVVRAPSNFYLHLTEVEVYADNACPPRLAANARQLPGTDCVNATYGGVCVQQCAPGFVTVGGAETSVCRGSSWDAAPLVCAPVCPELPPPDYADTCAKTLIADSFSADINGSFVNSLARWVSLDPGNQPIGRAFFSGDGVAQASSRWGCNTELFLVAGSANIFDFQGVFTMTSMVNTRDRAGVVRALDKANFIRFYIDVVEGVHVLDRMSGGVLTRLSDVRMPLSPDTWYRVALRQSGAVITVSINDIVVLTALDRTLVVGYVGVYAGTSGLFDDFSMISDCTSCSDAVPQDRCTFTCRPGLIQRGNTTRECRLSPDGVSAFWDGADASCTLPSPVFNGGTRAVNENALRNTIVGDPLVAVLSTPDETVSFAIISTTPSTFNPAPFWIDRCSGQLRVRNPAALNFEVVRRFTLNVSAYVQGFPGTETYRAVTVNINDVNEAPFIQRGQVLILPENATAGQLIATIRYWDPENTTALFTFLPPELSLVAIGNRSAGSVVIGSDTSLLNFESGTRSYSVTVQAADSWDPTLTDTTTLTLNIADSPDAPRLSNQVVRIFDSAAAIGNTFLGSVNATLEDNGPPAGPFASTVQFALVPYPDALAACPSSDVELPTTTGGVGGAPLFSINPTTGLMSVAALPSVPWGGRPPRPADGFARAAYSVCVNATNAGYRNRWTASTVRAVVLANLGNSAVITALQAMTPEGRLDTITPTQVWFTGANLPVGAVNGSSNAIAAWYTAPEGFAFNASGCTVVNSSAMFCFSSPGVGDDMEWTLLSGSNPIPATLKLVTSYYAPVVTGVSNHTGMPHEGGRYIRLTGRYFWGGSLAWGAYATLSYGPARSNLKYSCALIWDPAWTAAQRDSNAFCVADRGAGANLVWTLSVGSQTALSPDTDSSQQLSYIPPTISRIEMPVAGGGGNGSSRVNTTYTSTLDTRGGQRIILRGAGFGGDPSNTIIVRYSTFQSGSPVFTMASCARLTELDTTAVSCVTGEAIGGDLALKAEVEGQMSDATPGNASLGLGIGHARPVIRLLSGSFRSMSTAGVDSFFVEGNFLGPDLLGSPDWVRYGPLVAGAGAPFKYTAVSCSVFIPHTMLQCVAAPGSGARHWVQVSVGGQPSRPFNASMSYAPPVVGGFEGTLVANTQGGERVDIIGTNFGPIDDTTPINVTYSAKVEPWAAMPGGVTLAYTPANCSVVVPHTRMRCTYDEGAGKDLQWTVFIDGLKSVEPTTAYQPPTVTTIVNFPVNSAVTAANPLGSTVVEVRGSNLGPDVGGGGFAGPLMQEVTFGPVGNERVIAPSSVTYVSHSAVRVVLPPGTGSNMTVRVTVADQSSGSTATARFSYAAPTLVRLVPTSAPTFSDPSRPTKLVLQVTNMPMNDPLSRVQVLLGWGANQRVLDLDVYPSTNASWWGYRNPDGTFNISAELPRDGAGSRVYVAVQISPVQTGSAARFPVVTTAARYLRYLAPVIDNVVVVRTRWRVNGTAGADSDTSFLCPFPGGNPAWTCATTGLTTLIIYGANLGGPPATITGTPNAVSGPWGVVRSLDLGTQVSNSTPVTWMPPGTNANNLWLVRWDHTRIIVLSKLAAGTIRVRLAAPNDTLTVNEASATSVFANIAPEVRSASVSPLQAPTSGGAVVALQVQNILNADFLRVNIGGVYNCTLLESAQATATAITTETAWRTWFSAAPTTVLDGELTWTVFCRMPPGQGRDLPLVVTRVLSGASDPSDDGVRVSYAAPRVDSVGVDGGAQVPIVAGSMLYVATNGSVIRVRGQNMGVAPSVVLGDGYTLLTGDLRPCPGQAAPDLFPHACFEATTPQGEGTGVGLVPGPLGFTLVLAAGNQASVPLLYRHQSPVVSAVISATGRFPTQGGVAITITGRNFGFTRATRDPLVLVSFRRPGDRDPPRPCNGTAPGTQPGEADRVDHFTLRCVLPDGSGRDLEVMVVVAGVVSVPPGNGSVGFSYDPPAIANVTSYTWAGYDGSRNVILDASLPRPFYNSTNPDWPWYQANYTLDGGPVAAASMARPQIRSGTTGNDTVIVVDGLNFGSANPLAHCVCFCDVGRASIASLPEAEECVCNDAEDYLGEGELPDTRIISWSHERIMLRPAEGVGLKELRVSVRGNTLGLLRGTAEHAAQSQTIAYEPPRVLSVEPAILSTYGGQRIVLRGNNFGPAAQNLSTFDQQWDSERFARDGYVVPLSVAPSLPVAFLRFRFGRVSVASSVSIFGTPPQQLSSPDVDWARSVISWSHDTVVLEAPAGIGANRTLTVSVLVGRAGNVREWPSSDVPFNFAPPAIAYIAPSRVAMTDESPPRVKVAILGQHFGDDSKADEQGWSAAERALAVHFNGSVACYEPPKREYDAYLAYTNAGNPNAATGPIKIMCVLPANITTGYHQVSVTAAGQTGTVPAWPPTSSLHVVCQTGYFGRPNLGPRNTSESCLACPRVGALCQGFLSNVDDEVEAHTYPQPLPGFYNMNASDKLTTGMTGSCPGPQRGYIPGSIPGRDVCVVPCEPSESCLGQNYCAEGYRSKFPNYRCASCDLGFFRRAGQCIKCPDSPYMLVIGFILLIAVAAGLGVVLQKKQVNIAVVSIGIDFFQVLAIFSQSKIKWPPAIKELFHVLSAFNLNIEIVAPECLMPDVSYIQKFSAIMCLPIAVGGAMALLSVGAVIVKAIKGRKRNELMRHMATQVGLVLVLFYFLYLYLTRTLLDTFNCAPTEPSDGKEYLQVVFEECGIKDGTQVKLIPFSVVGLIVYTVGYPAFVLYWILYRNRVLIMEDQLLRAKGVGNDRLTNPHAYDLRKKFSRSYFQFKPDYWFWFGAIILRKFCIAATSVLFNRNSTFQMAACLLVMFCAYGLHLACRPYLSPSDYDDVLREHTQKAFTSTLHAKLRASIMSVESRGRKKARKNLMTPEGKVDRSALLGLLGNWLWNYNTIEAAMLWAAVIVCLMGLMYDALSRGYASDYSARGRDSLTSVVLGVIIAAIMYYATVLFSEIYLLYTEDQREKALKAASARKAGKSPAGTGASSKRLSIAPSNVPSGMAKGSIYDRAGAGGPGGFNTGALENSINPMALASARSVGGAGSALALDASSMEVVDSVSGMAGPPPPEVWRMVQATLKDMHAQLIDSKLREAELMAAQAAAGAFDPMASSRSKQAFEPQALGASAPTPGRAGPGGPASFTSFRGAGASPNKR